DVMVMLLRAGRGRWNTRLCAAVKADGRVVRYVGNAAAGNTLPIRRTVCRSHRSSKRRHWGRRALGQKGIGARVQPRLGTPLSIWSDSRELRTFLANSLPIRRHFFYNERRLRDEVAVRFVAGRGRGTPKLGNHGTRSNSLTPG